jgi:hypothetical protein
MVCLAFRVSGLEVAVAALEAGGVGFARTGSLVRVGALETMGAVLEFAE